MSKTVATHHPADEKNQLKSNDVNLFTIVLNIGCCRTF